MSSSSTGTDYASSEDDSSSETNSPPQPATMQEVWDHINNIITAPNSVGLIPPSLGVNGHKKRKMPESGRCNSARWRESSRRSRAYIKQLELEVARMQEENARLKTINQNGLLYISIMMQAEADADAKAEEKEKKMNQHRRSSSF